MGDLKDISFKAPPDAQTIEMLEGLLETAKAGRLKCVLATWYEDLSADGEFAPGGELIWSRNSSVLEMLGEAFRFTMQLYEESVERKNED